MMLLGGCHCGAVRYEVSGEAKHVALCHCNDCRKSSGAPMVSWAAFSESEFTVTKGEITTINSSGKTLRGFCAKCGTGISYRNEEFLPGIVDIQSVTLDDPDSLAPTVHIQTAERLGWMEKAHEIPAFERFPTQG